MRNTELFSFLLPLFFEDREYEADGKLMFEGLVLYVSHTQNWKESS